VIDVPVVVDSVVLEVPLVVLTLVELAVVVD
jgi:hypothetical protein